MKSKNYKYIKHPKPLEQRFGKDWNSTKESTKITVVGEPTLKRWLSGNFKTKGYPNTTETNLKRVVVKYLQLKYEYQVEQYRAKTFVDEIDELKKEITRLKKVERNVKNKLRNTLIFQDVSENLSKDIDDMLMDAFFKGEIKI